MKTLFWAFIAGMVVCIVLLIGAYHVGVVARAANERVNGVYQWEDSINHNREGVYHV